MLLFVLLFLFQIAVNRKLLVCQRSLEEEAGDITYYKDNQVAVNAEHISMVAEVPVF